MAFSQEATEAVPAWRDRALRRSLDAARTRSTARLDRLLDAARDLTDESGDAAFTVAQVAARAGMSLKSFYRCFAGKDELLLALLEEESRAGAAMLTAELAPLGDHAGRLQRCVEALFELAHQAPGYSGVLVREYRRLGVAHPIELGAALAPLEGEIEEASAAGVARPGDPQRAAAIVFALLLDGLAEVALAGRDSDEVCASLWHFVAGGLRIEDRGGSSRRKKGT